MRLLFELSGEHPTLPRAEVLAALQSEGVAVRSVTLGSSTLIVEAPRPPPRAWRRVALAHTVGVVLGSGGFDEILAAARRMRADTRSIRVRAPAFRGESRLVAERALGAAILAHGGRVDLDEPNLDFRLVGDGELHLVRVLHSVDRTRFERTHREQKAFGQPVSLHPKFARALVNLSRCPAGGRLLDPFCGMGGVLLEAVRIGAKVIGGDLLSAMVDRSRMVLRDFSNRVDLRTADIVDWSNLTPCVDAIATDPPYGRSTTTAREDLESLYRRAFRTFGEVLRPGAYAAVVLPSDPAVALGQESFDLEEIHALRVHRSLTRRFCVFRAGRR